eukprot:scaffold8630_cov115-Isochrysis_galbana.AAC.6
MDYGLYGYGYGYGCPGQRARARAGPGPLPLAPFLTAGGVGHGRAWGGGQGSAALLCPMPHAYAMMADHSMEPLLFWSRAVALLALLRCLLAAAC